MSSRETQLQMVKVINYLLVCAKRYIRLVFFSDYCFIVYYGKLVLEFLGHKNQASEMF